MRGILTFLPACFSAGVFFLCPPLAGAALPGVFVESGTSVTTEITASDEDAYAVELCDGDLLTVTAKASKGSTLKPTMRLFRPVGDEVDIDEPLFFLENFPLTETGAYTLVFDLSGGPAVTRQKIKFKGKVTIADGKAYVL